MDAIRYKVTPPTEMDKAPADEYEDGAAALMAGLDDLSDTDPAAAAALVKRMVAMLPKMPRRSEPGDEPLAATKATGNDLVDLTAWIYREAGVK